MLFFLALICCLKPKKESSQPYLRLIRFHQPVGTLLTMWPGIWSLGLGGPGILPPAGLVAVFAGGAFLVRSAGCVINDMADKKFDAGVARTSSRPLATGELTTSDAIITASVCLAGASTTLLVLNDLTRVLAVASLAPICAYPFMKRITWWPQAFLGLTFNWGALMGYAATHNAVSWSSFLLYAGCACWTVSYDTVYAHQDKADDARLGIRSTALVDDKTGNRIPIVFSLAGGAFWCSSLALEYGAWMGTLAALPPAALSLWLAIQSKRDHGKWFRRNHWVGPLMMMSIISCNWFLEASRSISMWSVP